MTFFILVIPFSYLFDNLILSELQNRKNLKISKNVSKNELYNIFLSIFDVLTKKRSMLIDLLINSQQISPL